MASTTGIIMKAVLFLWLPYLFAINAQSLLPVTATGSKLFDSSGKQFFIKGMTYDMGSNARASKSGTIAVDVLANPKQCALDAPLMKTLLVNTIRVYSVDNTANHTGCMGVFENAGIYVIIGLWRIDMKIDSGQPAWNQSLFDTFTKTLSEFSQYSNLLAVDIGTDVINKYEDSGAAPFLKAAARDVKAYRDAQQMRQIPVGYCSSEVLGIYTHIRDYLSCGGDNATTIDFYGQEDFSWCDPSPFIESGYAALYNLSLDYPLPLFLSETGCNKNDRSFDNQIAILGPQMNSKRSGSVIYEWPERESNYGIVSYAAPVISGSATVYGTSGTPTPISPDFYNLQSQWDTLTPTGVSRASYTPTQVAPQCPTFTSSGWTVKPNAPLPTIKNLVIPTKTGSSTGSLVTVSTNNGPVGLAAQQTSSELSTGAKVAVGVVIPIAVFGLAALAFILWRKRKAKQAATSTIEYSHVQPMQEAKGNLRAQLDGEDARLEPDSRTRYQLSDEAGVVPELRGEALLERQELSSGPSVRRNPRRSSYELP